MILDEDDALFGGGFGLAFKRTVSGFARESVKRPDGASKCQQTPPPQAPRPLMSPVPTYTECKVDELDLQNGRLGWKHETVLETPDISRTPRASFSLLVSRIPLVPRVPKESRGSGSAPEPLIH